VKLSRIYVHPLFKRKMKITAAMKNTSIVNLTKEMAADDKNDIIDVKKWKKQKPKNEFSFKI